MTIIITLAIFDSKFDAASTKEIRINIKSSFNYLYFLEVHFVALYM